MQIFTIFLLLAAIISIECRPKITLNKNLFFVRSSPGASFADITVNHHDLQSLKYLRICRRFLWFLNIDCRTASIDSQSRVKFNNEKFSEGKHRIAILREPQTTPLAVSKVFDILYVGQIPGFSPISVKSVQFQRYKDGTKLYARIELFHQLRTPENIVIKTFRVDTRKLLSRVETKLQEDSTIDLKVNFNEEFSYYLEIYTFKTTWHRMFRIKTLSYREYVEKPTIVGPMGDKTFVSICFNRDKIQNKKEHLGDEVDGFPRDQNFVHIIEEPEAPKAHFLDRFTLFQTKESQIVRDMWAYAFSKRLEGKLPRIEVGIPRVMTSLYYGNKIDPEIIYYTAKVWQKLNVPDTMRLIEFVHPGIYRVPSDDLQLQHYRKHYDFSKRFHASLLCESTRENQELCYWIIYDSKEHKFIIVNPSINKEYNYLASVGLIAYFLQEHMGFENVPQNPDVIIRVEKQDWRYRYTCTFSGRFESPYWKFIRVIEAEKHNVKRESGILALLNMISILQSPSIKSILLGIGKYEVAKIRDIRIYWELRKQIYIYLGSLCQKYDPHAAFPSCFHLHGMNEPVFGEPMIYERFK